MTSNLYPVYSPTRPAGTSLGPALATLGPHPRQMVKHRIVVLAPLVVLPLILLDPEQPSVGRMAWTIALMAIFWATEALPVAVSSMLPLVLLPALGIMPAERVANNYFKDMCVLFFGGLVVAAALEAVGLHRRIALKVLLTCGTKPAQLLLGFMSATAFLSMWMSNTATTAMMMPIVARLPGAATSLGCTASSRTRSAARRVSSSSDGRRRQSSRPRCARREAMPQPPTNFQISEGRRLLLLRH